MAQNHEEISNLLKTNYLQKQKVVKEMFLDDSHAKKMVGVRGFEPPTFTSRT